MESKDPKVRAFLASSKGVLAILLSYMILNAASTRVLILDSNIKNKDNIVKNLDAQIDKLAKYAEDLHKDLKAK